MPESAIATTLTREAGNLTLSVEYAGQWRDHEFMGVRQQYDVTIRHADAGPTSAWDARASGAAAARMSARGPDGLRRTARASGCRTARRPRPCSGCYRADGGLRGIHGQVCADGAVRSQAEYDATQARLDAGEPMVLAARGDWSERTPAPRPGAGQVLRRDRVVDAGGQPDPGHGGAPDGPARRETLSSTNGGSTDAFDAFRRAAERRARRD